MKHGRRLGPLRDSNHQRPACCLWWCGWLASFCLTKFGPVLSLSLGIGRRTLLERFLFFRRSYRWLRASRTITFWWFLFLSSPEALANLMLWWGRSLALIQIMFQSLLEDLKPQHASLEDGGNEACWDFNHFYICWKIRRKEGGGGNRGKEEINHPSLPGFTLLEKIICFEDWYNENQLLFHFCVVETLQPWSLSAQYLNTFQRVSPPLIAK